MQFLFEFVANKIKRIRAIISEIVALVWISILSFLANLGTISYYGQIKHSKKIFSCSWIQTYNLVAGCMYLVCVVFVVGGLPKSNCLNRRVLDSYQVDAALLGII